MNPRTTSPLFCRACGIAATLLIALGALGVSQEGAAPPPDGPGALKPPKPPKREVIDTLDRWREVDRQLLDSARRFNEINERKKKLDKRLGEARGNFEPGDLKPTDAWWRKDAAKSMGQLEDLLTDMRKQREKIGRLAWSISGSRVQLGAMLENRRRELEAKSPGDRDAGETDELGRVLAWQRSLAAGMDEGPQEFYLHLLGGELAPELLESVRESRRPRGDRERPPFAEPGRGGPPPGANAFDPERDSEPEAMEDRLRRLERNQRAQQALIRRQREEIQLLRERLSKYEPVDESGEESGGKKSEQRE